MGGVSTRPVSTAVSWTDLYGGGMGAMGGVQNSHLVLLLPVGGNHAVGSVWERDQEAVRNAACGLHEY